jgi:hypothetical protein
LDLGRFGETRSALFLLIVNVMSVPSRITEISLNAARHL